MKAWFAGLAAVMLLGGALAMGVAAQSSGKIAPAIKVAGITIGGMTHEQALVALKGKASTPPQINITAGKQNWTLSADKLGWKADAITSVAAAEKFTADRNVLERLQNMVGQSNPQDFPLVAQVDPAVAKATLDDLTKPLNTQPKNAVVYFDAKTNKYAVKPDVIGRQYDAQPPADAYAKDPNLSSLTVPVKEWKATYTAATLQNYATEGNALVRPFTATLKGNQRTAALTGLQIANLYWVRETGIVPDEKTMQVAFNRLTDLVDQPAQNARYVLQGTSLVKTKEKDGLVTDRPMSYAAFKKAVLDPSQKTVAFSSKVSKPTLTSAQLPAADKLELIAVGHSTYYHSSPARRSNVANAAAKINGAVVAPGEVFSFLNTLGGITSNNGFIGGLIISGGRTVDGLGGGVCQVSTTTFRAMYKAGLPVVERNQHSYRVGYYEPSVGFEAAVYDPGLDLKFRNDTAGPILVKTINYPRSSALDVQIWGIKPKRSVYISGATILSQTRHLPAQYVVNPKLRAGQTKQVDWAADGYNLYITRTIKDASGTRTDVTRTNYKPWRAVYEVASGGVPTRRN